MTDKSAAQADNSASVSRKFDKPETILEESWPQSLEEFEALVEAYQHRLIRYAFRRLGRHEDAEDVIQQVFTRAFLERGKKKKIRRPGPYLYRMAANACTDHLRKHKRAEVPLEIVPDEELAADQGSSGPGAALIEIRRIEALLRPLPEKQAEVIRLRVTDELSFAEIAEILECSVSTIKSRFRYGIEKLRSRISRDLEVIK